MPESVGDSELGDSDMYPGLKDEDLRPMTPEQIPWFLHKEYTVRHSTLRSEQLTPSIVQLAMARRALAAEQSLATVTEERDEANRKEQLWRAEWEQISETARIIREERDRYEKALREQEAALSAWEQRARESAAENVAMKGKLDASQAVVEAAEGIDWWGLADKLDNRVGHGPDLPDSLRLLGAALRLNSERDDDG